MANGDICFAAQQVLQIVPSNDFNPQLWRGIAQAGQDLRQDISRHNIRGS